MKNTITLMKRTAGYTIDQTILIVAVIAVLITLIIASVGWDLLNRTAGTKLASQFRQVEDSNGQFFARQGVWPHTAIAQEALAACTNASQANIAALAGECLAVASGYYARRTNLIAGLKYNSTAHTIGHGFGNGGIVSQVASANASDGNACPGGFRYLIVTFGSLAATELNEADEAIDAGDGPDTGRIQWNATGTEPFNGEYCANLLGR
jgi:hypothetical protein